MCGPQENQSKYGIHQHQQQQPQLQPSIQLQQPLQPLNQLIIYFFLIPFFLYRPVFLFLFYFY